MDRQRGGKETIRGDVHETRSDRIVREATEVLDLDARRASLDAGQGLTGDELLKRLRKPVTTSRTAGEVEAPTAPWSSWQLILTGSGLDEISGETCADLKRILELLPSVTHLTVTTAKGEVLAARNFRSGYALEVDQRIGSAFRASPGVQTIAFPETPTSAERVVTSEDPHLFGHTKLAADIQAAFRRGEITVDEVLIALKDILRNDN